MQTITAPQEPTVTRLSELPDEAMTSLLHRHGLRLNLLPEHADIPASYWGAPEAGIKG